MAPCSPMARTKSNSAHKAARGGMGPLNQIDSLDFWTVVIGSKGTHDEEALPWFIASTHHSDLRNADGSKRGIGVSV